MSLTVPLIDQMGFEILVLGLVLWNAIDRPRSLNTPLRRVLHYDGIAFFGVSLCPTKLTFTMSC